MLTPEELDARLAAGDRRTGRLLYRTQCPACTSCEPIRLRVADFIPSRSQARTVRKGDEVLTTRIAPPVCDQARVALYNRHKQGRGLTHGESAADASDYAAFLVDTCADTIEFSYWYDDRLVSVGISDRGANALNAVYCCFEPEFPGFGLGTYNVLKQVQLCREWGLEFLYLGLFIAESPHMNYKASYLPHERLIAGQWQRFDREA